MRPVSIGGVSFVKICGKRIPGEERAKSGDHRREQSWGVQAAGIGEWLLSRRVWVGLTRRGRLLLD